MYESENRKASTVRSAHQDQKKRWVNDIYISNIILLLHCAVIIELPASCWTPQARVPGASPIEFGCGDWAASITDKLTVWYITNKTCQNCSSCYKCFLLFRMHSWHLCKGFTYHTLNFIIRSRVNLDLQCKVCEEFLGWIYSYVYGSSFLNFMWFHNYTFGKFNIGM